MRISDWSSDVCSSDLDGTAWTEQQLYLKSIDLTPSSTSYNNLGCTLRTGERISLLDGSVLTKKQLYLKAVYLDDDDYSTWYNLAMSIPQKRSIQERKSVV